MKKILPVMLLLFISITGCATKSKIEVYPYDYIGLYDMSSKAALSIGDSKEILENIIGRGKLDDYGIYDYGHNLSIQYGIGGATSDYMSYFEISSIDDNTEHYYQLPDGTTCNVPVTEFTDLYKNVYWDNTYEAEKTAAIFVEDTDNGKIILDKDTLLQISGGLRAHETIYKISVGCISYNVIERLRIEEISNPTLENWDVTLSEID